MNENHIQVTSELPKNISDGIEKGKYQRVGGTIRDVESNEILAWLREATEIGAPIISEILSFGVTTTTQANTLNLAISTMGFPLVMKRLNTIEQELKQVQEALNIIDYKIDLSFYANFKAAIDLAANSFIMANPEMRKVSALQAINRFLEAEHHYTDIVDSEIANGSQVAEDYLTTLSLAYITEVRCYLELEELDTACQRLQESLAVLRPRFKKFIETLLTSNPAAYLHPSLRGQIDLQRLTRVYRWLHPTVDENTMFEIQRENLFNLALNPEVWIASLPQAIHIPKKGGIFSQKMIMDFAKRFEKLKKIEIPKQVKDFSGVLFSMSKGLRNNPLNGLDLKQFSTCEIYERLPQILELIEEMIENFSRLETYLEEIKTIQQLGSSFKEWRQLGTPLNQANSISGLKCIMILN